MLYTTEYLLQNAMVVTELCIKSKEEYRLWQELRRISSLTETKIGGNIDKDSVIEGFSSEEIKILIREEKISVECNGGSYDFTREEFNRRPRWVMERIIRIIT